PVGKIEWPSLLERPALPVTESQIAAARDVDVVPAAGQILDLVAAIRVGARRQPIVREPRSVDLDARAPKRPAAVGGKDTTANRRGARGGTRRCRRIARRQRAALDDLLLAVRDAG